MYQSTHSAPKDGTRQAAAIPATATPPQKAAVPFASMELAEPLLRGLHDNGFVNATEIQARALPPGLAGQDVLASAQTGTGKTAAFVLPALQRLLTPARQEGRGPRVLILTPTRELAGQVEAVIRQLGKHTKLRSGTLVGGMSYGPQERLLRNGVDLLVATPGRLMDHMSAGLVDYSRLELFVLDEADRMLDMGFIKPVQRISAALPEFRQTLLFSATLEGVVMQVAKRLLKDPERIHLSPARQRNQAITQHLHTTTGPEHKHALLSHFLTDPEVNQAIVFTATKRGADKLAKRLKASGLTCAALHGNMRQNARLKTVDDLRRGRVQILVATDVAARGIDVEGVSHVINFDLPIVAEDYIHRIGRTGRNGATGTAITLVSAQDKVKLHRIEKLTGHSMVRLNVQDLRVLAEPEHRPGRKMTVLEEDHAPAHDAPRRRPGPNRGRGGAFAGKRGAPRREAGPGRDDSAPGRDEATGGRRPFAAFRGEGSGGNGNGNGSGPKRARPGSPAEGKPFRPRRKRPGAAGGYASAGGQGRPNGNHAAGSNGGNGNSGANGNSRSAGSGSSGNGSSAPARGRRISRGDLAARPR